MSIDISVVKQIRSFKAMTGEGHKRALLMRRGGFLETGNWQDISDERSRSKGMNA